MFEFLLRKTIFKGLSKEDQDVAMLLKYKIKADFLSFFLIYVFGALPLVFLVTLLINPQNTFIDVLFFILIILAYISFAVYFVRHFKKPIKIFMQLISASMYSSQYVLKGNAILKDDFEIIKEEKKILYYGMMTQQVNGFCYSVCFDILKCLKKGTIQFVAIISNHAEYDNKYTMHVLYVNDNWCYDTYSQRQYPLEEVLKRMKAKTYTSFAYEDVAENTYEEFRSKHALALKEWCEANDCYQEWLTKS